MGYTSIGKASGEGVITLGQEAWNIADGYTKIKILKLLIELDLYENIATYGKQSFDDDIPYQTIPERRVEGMHRVIFVLRQLIGNCRFSIDKGEDEKLVTNFLKRLDNVENVIDGIANVYTNEVTKEDEVVINEEHFKRCFNICRNIKDELNFPVNRAGLIFRQSEEMDLDKIMNEIIEGG